MAKGEASSVQATRRQSGVAVKSLTTEGVDIERWQEEGRWKKTAECRAWGLMSR